MAAARHPIPPEIAALSLEEIAERYIGRFRDKVADWEAFEDAKIEGYRRAQHRFIGAGGSGKHDDPTVIPPRVYPQHHRAARPGQRRAYPRGRGGVFRIAGIPDGVPGRRTGRRLSRKLAPWECIACPPGVIHGFQNDGLEPAHTTGRCAAVGCLGTI